MVVLFTLPVQSRTDGPLLWTDAQGQVLLNMWVHICILAIITGSVWIRKKEHLQLIKDFFFFFFAPMWWDSCVETATSSLFPNLEVILSCSASSEQWSHSEIYMQINYGESFHSCSGTAVKQHCFSLMTVNSFSKSSSSQSTYKCFNLKVVLHVWASVSANSPHCKKNEEECCSTIILLPCAHNPSLHTNKNSPCCCLDVSGMCTDTGMFHIGHKEQNVCRSGEDICWIWQK